MVSWPPRSSQETPQSIPEEPKSLRRGSQEHPKGAQELTKTLSEPWSDQKRRFFTIRRMSELKSMILRVGGSSWELKIDPESRRGEETRLRRRYEPQKVSREPQEEPKMVSWLPRSSQETPKSIPEESKSLPRGSQEHPKGAQESAKTLSEPWSDQKRRFFRIRRMSKLKSMILSVRGSSWELKIDPERVEEENKHV